MPLKEVPPYLWVCIDGILKEAKKSDDWKYGRIYHHLTVPGDPPIPTDFPTSPDYSHYVVAILEHARNQSPELPSLVDKLQDAIRAWLHRTSPAHSGQKRSRAVVEDLEHGTASRSSSIQADETIGALDSDIDDNLANQLENTDSGRDFESTLRIRRLRDFADDDISNAPAQHRQKRARVDPKEPAPTYEVDYQDLDSILCNPAFEKLMDDIEDGLIKFINDSGTLPSWDPTANWEDYPDILAHLKNLDIPCIPLNSDAVPDMLLAGLGSGTQARSLDNAIRQRWLRLVYPALKSWHLVNASGSGKTRLLFEILVRHWSFYLACGHDQVRTPYGSKDVTRALDFIASSTNKHHTKDGGLFRHRLRVKIDDEVSLETLDATIDQREINKAIATHVFSATMLARCLIFECFLICWQRCKTPDAVGPRLPGRHLLSARKTLLEKYCNGTHVLDQSAAIRSWAFVQIYPQLILPTGTSGDMFSQVLALVQWVKPDAIEAAVNALMLNWRILAQVQFSTIMFDEVQTLASRWRWAFGPENPGNSPRDEALARKFAQASRPVLKPLLVAVTNLMPAGSKTLIAATKFNESTIEAAIGSGVAKILGGLERFIDFGDQGTPAEIAGTLKHYFGPGILKLIDPELWSEITYWLIGRHRYLMVFIQFVLYLGPKSMGNVLKNLIWRLTKHRPLGLVPLPEMDLGPVLAHDARLKDKVQQNHKLYHSIKRIVYAWIFNNQFPLFPPERIELVTLGIGRLVPACTPDTPATIRSTENLTASALYGWMDGEEQKESLSTMLDDDLSSIEPTTRGYALENALVYQFWDKFSVGCRLDEVFDFVYLPPSWAGRKARLVDVCAKFTESGASRLHERLLASRLAWNCTKIAQTAAWFRKGGLANMRIPFLRPDNLAGPDIFFILRLDTGEEILICVQSKAWSGKHRGSSVLEEIFKLSPERFYGSKNAPKTEAAKETIAKRKSQIQALLSRMLLPSKLDMSPPKNTVFEDTDEYAYDRESPKYPLLRVFAAYEGSFDLGDTTPGKMGRYPLAILSSSFLEEARKRFTSMDEAAKAVGAYKDEIEEEKKLAQQREAEEREMLEAWEDYEDNLEELLATVAGIDAREPPNDDSGDSESDGSESS